MVGKLGDTPTPDGFESSVGITPEQRAALIASLTLPVGQGGKVGQDLENEPTVILPPPPPSDEVWLKFEIELGQLINKYSLENGSNTPDFILAAFLVEQLKLFNATLRRRDSWYGTNNKRLTP